MRLSEALVLKAEWYVVDISNRKIDVELCTAMNDYQYGDRNLINRNEPDMFAEVSKHLTYHHTGWSSMKLADICMLMLLESELQKDEESRFEDKQLRHAMNYKSGAASLIKAIKQ